MIYVPILKCKKGEKDALDSLNDDLKDQVLPLLEICPDIIAKGTFNGASDFWENRQYLLDVSPEYRDELTDQESFELLSKCGNEQVIPVVRLYDSDEKIMRFNNELSNGFALRLYLEDISDESFSLEFEHFIQSVNLQNVDLIIDAQSIDTGELSQKTFLIRAALELVRNINQFRRVIFASNSFPSKLDIQKERLVLLPREESTLFSRVSPLFASYGVTPIYSDYAINHWSYFVFIPGMQPSFNIRYTTEDNYVIYKGLTTKRGGLNIENVRSACQMLVQSPYYFGADFSWGDNEIYLKAVGETTRSGNPTTWRAIGTNHHITFILNHLSNQF
ncbi:beta family protein [Sporolactobacillus sp. STCC-11]|uniref:beta family protein n=1 Tax=Sporolactobacillus caesalpiniae TaxID=3230362 RepID=UPI003394BC16